MQQIRTSSVLLLSASTLLLNRCDARGAPSRMIQEQGPCTIEVKMVQWAAPFYVFTEPDGEHRSIVYESTHDRPEKVRTFSRTHAPSFFAGCVANLPTQHPPPSSRHLLAPRDLKSSWGWHARVRSSGAGALRIRPRHGVRRGVTQARRRAGVEKPLVLG